MTTTSSLLDPGGGDDAHDGMARLIFGARILAQVLKCVAQFDVADHLADEPRDPSDLAARAGLDVSSAARLLRYCATIGLTRPLPDGRFEGTEILATLRATDPQDLRSFALAQNGPGQWAVLGRLDEALRTGNPQATHALGCGLYDYYGLPENADEATAYRRGLVGRGVDVQAAVAQMIDTRGVHTVLDIGGSVGSLVVALLAANDQLRGAVLDLPEVAAAADAHARRHGLSDRFEFIAGDFFERVPSSDLYLLQNVLGNWDDAHCRTILENGRRAARPGSRWVIVEPAIDDSRPGRWSVDVDIITMVTVGGRVRTLEDYRRLLTDSGLRFLRDAPVTSAFHLIEAVL